MSIASYIEGLSLADAAGPSVLVPDFAGVPRFAGGEPGEPTLPTISEDLESAVDTGTVLSFVEGVNALEMDDILFSTQLAHRGATGYYDPFTQTESWYQKYREVLENLGWVVEHFAFARYDQDEGEYRIDKVALQILVNIATANQLTVLQQAITALEGLAEDEDAIRLFDFFTSREMSGNFQVGAVQKADNGALSMALGAFYFRTVNVKRRFLFVSWNTEEINFWTAAQKMTLNSTYYAGHREAVRARLPDAEEYIAGLMTREPIAEPVV